LDDRRRALGDDHPELVLHLSLLAQACVLLGDLGEAEPLSRRMLEIQEGSLGPGHPDCVETGKMLAGVRKRHLEQLNKRTLRVRGQGHTDQAIEAAPGACDLCRASLGDGAPVLATFLLTLAGMHHEAGNPLAAEPLYL